MVQDTCLLGTNCWLLTIKVNNYQNTELREWIAFHLIIVWLLVCLLCLLIVLCCMLLIAVKLIYVGHKINDCGMLGSIVVLNV